MSESNNYICNKKSSNYYIKQLFANNTTKVNLIKYSVLDNKILKL